MNYSRVMLRFPKGHWIESIPKGDRTKRVREILETGFRITQWNNRIDALQDDIREIKTMLKSGALAPTKTEAKVEIDERIEKADIALIAAILDL